MYISTTDTIHTHVYTYSLILPPDGLDLVTSCLLLLARAYFAHSYTKAIASRMLLRQSATALPRAHCLNQGKAGMLYDTWTAHELPLRLPF